MIYSAEDGFVAYYDENGFWHREDGPARSGGSVVKPEYYIHGKRLSLQEFERYMRLKAFL